MKKNIVLIAILSVMSGYGAEKVVTVDLVNWSNNYKIAVLSTSGKWIQVAPRKRVTKVTVNANSLEVRACDKASTTCGFSSKGDLSWSGKETLNISTNLEDGMVAVLDAGNSFFDKLNLPFAKKGFTASKTVRVAELSLNDIAKHNIEVEGKTAWAIKQETDAQEKKRLEEEKQKEEQEKQRQAQAQAKAREEQAKALKDAEKVMAKWRSFKLENLMDYLGENEWAKNSSLYKELNELARISPDVNPLIEEYAKEYNQKRKKLINDQFDKIRAVLTQEANPEIFVALVQNAAKDTELMQCVNYLHKSYPIAYEFKELLSDADIIQKCTNLIAELNSMTPEELIKNKTKFEELFNFVKQVKTKQFKKVIQQLVPSELTKLNAEMDQDKDTDGPSDKYYMTIDNIISSFSKQIKDEMLDSDWADYAKITKENPARRFIGRILLRIKSAEISDVKSSDFELRRFCALLSRFTDYVEYFRQKFPYLLSQKEYDEIIKKTIPDIVKNLDKVQIVENKNATPKDMHLKIADPKAKITVRDFVIKK